MNPYSAVFDAQKEYFASNVTRSYEWRVEQLDRMSRMVTENTVEFQQAIAGDFKTSRQEYDFETSTAIAEVEFQRSQLQTWMEPVEAQVPRALAATGHKAMIYREPYGVTLVIGPFNGPLTLLIRPAIAVLAAGNTCILKPSEALTVTSALLARLVPEYFDPRAVCVVAADREKGSQLLDLPFDFLFFTGSTRTGKVMARAAAENLTPVLLELGGINPALVDETANLPDAARKIVWGAMAWGGQWCTSPGYACVHESVAEEFVSQLAEALMSLYGPDPRNNSDYSRIISEHDVLRLAALIDPGKVIAGGRSEPQARYLDPTILYPVSWDDKIMEEEIFGPVLPVITYRTFDEALSRIASKPRPLAAYVFSRDQSRIDRFTGELSFGVGAVNQVNLNVLIESMPFGGTGPSGLGHYYGKYGFDMLTHAKPVVISPPDVAISHLFPPATDEKIEAFSAVWYDY
jgi:acyl-CoA reductase-like NAD-dependent aldehyde dehydrogenase